jgi:hypothetical protein
LRVTVYHKRSTMNASKSASAIWLEDTSTYINRYFTLAVFLFDFTGNLFECHNLFSAQSSFESSAQFFLTSTTASRISMLFGVTTRILPGWYCDLISHTNWRCKLRTYVFFSSRAIAFWLTMFTIIDR